jgi:anaerobic selenocysteine-containing dehydrogenase
MAVVTFVHALGLGAHMYSASSQDTHSRFMASQLLYGIPSAVPIPDLSRTDLLVVMGANPVVSHGSVLTAPRIRERMHAVVKRGGRVIVIDPRKTETAAQFEWLGITPDTDALLLLSLLQVMFAENLGTIPPNTALMVLTISGKRYEVNITSSEQTSGTVRFKWSNSIIRIP